MAVRNCVLLLGLLVCVSCYRRENDDAVGGGGGSSAVGPTVTGFARYYDADRSGSASIGDRIVVPFSSPVRVTTPDPAALSLAVPGDEFGTGASLIAGPGASEVTLTLGNGARLKTRQTYGSVPNQANAPSGIDVAATPVPDAIEDASNGADARAGAPIDVVPGFVPAADFASGPAAGLAAVDLDRDGDLDLALARADGGFVIWSGPGDGTFPTASAFGASPATCMVLADLDRDGRADVVLGTGGRDEVWLADAAGGFVLDSMLSSDELSGALAASDIDADGDLDLLAAGAAGLRVYLNDGEATFAPAAGYGAGAEALGLGDVDRDGHVDVIAAGSAGGVVWRGDGAGGLIEGVGLAGSGTRVLALADVDLDGDLDLLAGNDGGDVLWLGDGAGAFDQAQVFPDAPTLHLAFADFDQDAQPDLFVGGSAGTVVWLNQGGAFSPVESIAAAQLGGLATGDLDGDGDVDLALATVAGGTRVHAGSLRGTWGSSTLTAAVDGIGPGPSLALAAGDADRDGDPDLASGADAEALLFTNERDESFLTMPQRLDVIAGLVRDLAFADVDQDGDLDLLAIRREEFVTFLNDGNGGLSASAETITLTDTLSAFSLALDVGDVDRDGDPDVVVGNLLGVDVLIPNLGSSPEGWRGFGQRVRLPQTAPVPERTRTTDVALSDIDGDGDLDLLLTQSAGAPGLVYRNDGTGVLAESEQQLGARGASALAVMDLDLDGDPDLATASDAGVAFWTNDGSGTFSAGTVLASERFVELALRDLDGDRRAELIAVRAEAPATDAATVIWQGGLAFAGNPGGFLGAPLLLAPGRAVLELSDLDLDGDVDLILGYEDPAQLIRPFWNR